MIEAIQEFCADEPDVLNALIAKGSWEFKITPSKTGWYVAALEAEYPVWFAIGNAEDINYMRDWLDNYIERRRNVGAEFSEDAEHEAEEREGSDGTGNDR